jgi:hypothetical protein
MPITLPLGFTHLLPGEQSVSNEHAKTGTLDSVNATTPSQNLALSFFTKSPPEKYRRRQPAHESFRRAFPVVQTIMERGGNQ